ncbi:MAG: MtrB/PioB family decaheme-associated outer membrane protein [Alphaproteobacteria bacterium]
MKRIAIVAAMATTCLLPLAVRADGPVVTDNYIDVGAGYVSGKSFYFGRFTGLVDPGFAVGDFGFWGRDAWDSGGTRYWNIEGHNLGLTSRSFSAEYGQQGTWGVKVYYDGIPYYASDSFHSVYNKNGTLASGLAPGKATSATALTGKENVFDVSLQRDIFGGNFHYEVGDWVFSTDIRQEHKEGIQETGFTFGSTPVSPSYAAVSTASLQYFPQPVNYDTGRYQVMGQYNGQRLQAQLSYNLSVFNDNVNSIQLANPFALSAASFGPGVAGLSAYWSTPPSNSAHQIKAQVGYNVLPTTRINVNFAYGLQIQNDAFAPSTGNSSVVGTSIPRSSFNGLINTIYGNAAITSNPLERLDLRASYTIDDRDNMSPRNAYTTAVGDTTTISTNYNIPYSELNQKATLEGGYRVLPQTKITLDYAYDSTVRTFADTKDVTENSFGGKVRSNIVEDVNASLGYMHDIRDAHNYNQYAPWAFINMGANEDFNGLFKYFEASRTRDEVKGNLDFSPGHEWNGSFMVKFDNDDYPQSTLGLRSNDSISLGPDLTWEPTDDLTLHGYYTYQRVYYNQNDVYWTTSTCNANGFTSTAACNGQWNGKTTDQVHTVGFEADWKAIPDKLKIKLSYNLSYGDTNFVISDGGALALGAPANASLVTAPLPDVVSLLNSLNLRAEYALRPDITLFAGDTLERLDYQDWAYTASTIYSTGLLPGDSKPSYFINLFLMGVRYRF